ncbi:colicin immunity protein Cui [Erwinia sp. HDF1-3R]|uniref:colicin immunity protein Cui n=1 Tax=Erwinia sp. HDF1-3R TaxID=3141543 RepID=UPI0031F4E4A2
MRSIEEDNKLANRLSYLFLFAGVIPLVVIWAMDLHNADSAILKDIAARTADLPGLISAKNPLMTKVMDVYCKTAPILAFLCFACTIKIRKVIKNVDRAALIRSCLLSPFFYAFCFYLLLCCDHELTTAGRPLRLMSGHNSLLLLAYIAFYFVIFMLSYGVLFIPVIVRRLLKERRQ